MRLSLPLARLSRNSSSFIQVRTARPLEPAITRASTAAAQHLARRSYATEPSNNPSNNPSKVAQAIQQANLDPSRSDSSFTPSADKRLGIPPETIEMAPLRRGAKAGAKPPNVDRNGKLVTTEPKPSASYVLSVPAHIPPLSSNQMPLRHRTIANISLTAFSSSPPQTKFSSSTELRQAALSPQHMFSQAEILMPSRMAQYPQPTAHKDMSTRMCIELEP